MFITGSGKELINSTAAREEISTNGAHSAEDLRRLDFFLQNLLAARKLENPKNPEEGWQVEESISSRWKSKFRERSIRCSKSYKSPDGQIFQTRVKVLQHMLANGFPKEEVVAVVDQMKRWEGWQESEFLPPNWLMKETKIMDATNTRPSTWTQRFLAPTGVLLKSTRNVLEFLQKNGNADQKDVEKIRLLKKRLAEAKVGLTPNWKSIHWLPEGWTFCSDVRRTYFRASSGEILKSRRACLKVLIQNGDRKNAQKMLGRLHLENWKSDRLLPEGWRYKIIGQKEISRSKKLKELSFLSSDASIINGIESAKAMIAKDGDNEENKDMQSFQLFLESQCSAKREEKNYKWRKADETVPAGWMIAPRSNMVRSPSGLYFVNRSNLEVFFSLFYRCCPAGELHCST